MANFVNFIGTGTEIFSEILKNFACVFYVFSVQFARRGTGVFAPRGLSHTVNDQFAEEPVDGLCVGFTFFPGLQ